MNSSQSRFWCLMVVDTNGLGQNMVSGRATADVGREEFERRNIGFQFIAAVHYTLIMLSGGIIKHGHFFRCDGCVSEMFGKEVFQGSMVMLGRS